MVNLNPVWDKTIAAKRRLSEHPEFEVRIQDDREVCYFRGRHLIGHDTPINGGVYVGQGVREALVVEDKEQPKLHGVYSDFLAKRVGKNKKGVLTEVFEYVREVMPPSHGVLEKLSLWEGDKELDPEFPLGDLIGVGGVCRHLPLLIGYILERMINAGLLGGKVSVDRNFIPFLGGHAWVRYVSKHGRVVILDPVIIKGGYKAYLDEIRNSRGEPWDYFRPEDLD